MRTPFGILTTSSVFVLVSVQSALSQSSAFDKPSEHPSGAQLLEGVEHWFADHRGAGIMVGVSVAIALGLVIYNRFIATR